MGVFGIGGRGKDDGEEKGKLKLDPAQAARALPLLVALLAFVFFHEVAPPATWAGAGVIILAVVLANSRGQRE